MPRKLLDHLLHPWRKLLRRGNFSPLLSPTFEQDLNNFSDIPDEEIEQYLNGEEEIAVKTKVWESNNYDFIERQEMMEKLQKENPAEFKKRYPWKAGKSGKRKQATSERKSPEDAAEAAELALATKYV